MGFAGEEAAAPGLRVAVDFYSEKADQLSRREKELEEELDSVREERSRTLVTRDQLRHWQKSAPRRVPSRPNPLGKRTLPRLNQPAGRAVSPHVPAPRRHRRDPAAAARTQAARNAGQLQAS